MNIEDFLALDLNKIPGRPEGEPGRDLREIHEILKAETKIGRVLEQACGNCRKKEVYCGYADLGAADYIDNFWHLCLNCLDARHEERRTGSCQETNCDLTCPFCGYDWRMGG